MTFHHEGPLSPEAEQELMQQLMNGDDGALRALYGRFSASVYTLGLRMLGSSQEAEELTQDVFVAAWRKGDRFDPSRGRLSTWLMAIGHNLARGLRYRGARIRWSSRNSGCKSRGRARNEKFAASWLLE